MVKILFAILVTGTLFYVATPLFGRKVQWVDAEEPGDEKIRELQLKKKINLKALKDIEFELASGKINDEDYQQLRAHYMHKVSGIMDRMEILTAQSQASLATSSPVTSNPGFGPEDGEILRAHNGGRVTDDPTYNDLDENEKLVSEEEDYLEEDDTEDDREDEEKEEDHRDGS